MSVVWDGLASPCLWLTLNVEGRLRPRKPLEAGKPRTGFSPEPAKERSPAHPPFVSPVLDIRTAGLQDNKSALF